MTDRDTTTSIVAILGIVAIVTVSILAGFDHTLTKLGLVTIAGVAGFTLRGLAR